MLTSIRRLLRLVAEAAYSERIDPVDSWKTLYEARRGEHWGDDQCRRSRGRRTLGVNEG